MAPKKCKCDDMSIFTLILTAFIVIYLAKWIHRRLPRWIVEAFHDDEHRDLVPMILPGEQLYEYKQRLFKHQNDSFKFDGRPPMFDGEYIQHRIDNSQVIKPLNQRIFLDE